MDLLLLTKGLGIFFARIIDVSLGTVRTINLIQGRSIMAFLLGLVEATMWLVVVAAVLKEISVEPLLGVFYAFGFSAGNVVGILIEKRLALGSLILRIISSDYEPEMTRELREMGFAVTVFTGEGRDGPVRELYVVCQRRDFKKIIAAVEEVDPHVFYVTEQPGATKKLPHRMSSVPGGWRRSSRRK